MPVPRRKPSGCKRTISVKHHLTTALMFEHRFRLTLVPTCIGALSAKETRGKPVSPCLAGML